MAKVTHKPCQGHQQRARTNPVGDDRPSTWHKNGERSCHRPSALQPQRRRPCIGHRPWPGPRPWPWSSQGCVQLSFGQRLSRSTSSCSSSCKRPVQAWRHCRQWTDPRLWHSLGSGSSACGTRHCQRTPFQPQRPCRGTWDKLTCLQARPEWPWCQSLPQQQHLLHHPVRHLPAGHQSERVALTLTSTWPSTWIWLVESECQTLLGSSFGSRCQPQYQHWQSSWIDPSWFHTWHT